MIKVVLSEFFSSHLIKKRFNPSPRLLLSPCDADRVVKWQQFTDMILEIKAKILSFMFICLEEDDFDYFNLNLVCRMLSSELSNIFGIFVGCRKRIASKVSGLNKYKDTL
jgi:hypothetical protein